jgi:rhamnosyltransferase subunit B
MKAAAAGELRELLDNPKYATKAAEIGQIIRSENGVILACNAIKHQLEIN